MKAMKSGKEIIINRMYVGGYLSNNLGHEIINLYKADKVEGKAKNYVYIQPYGSYGKGHDIGCVLLVRGIGGGQIEVLGKAEGLTPVFNPASGADNKAIQQKFIKENKVTYGGVGIDEIFAKFNSKQDINITFEAESVLKPNKKVIIAFGKADKNHDSDTVVVHLTQHNQARASLKQYITLSNDTDSDYERLLALINDKDLWVEDTTGITDKDMAVSSIDENIFDICGIQDRELAFSSALTYFFSKYPDFARGVIAKVFGIDIPYADNIRITNEENNIDILIRYGDNYIVIENKIRSDLNGLIYKDKSSKKKDNLERTQLNKYVDYVKDERDNNEDLQQEIGVSMGESKIFCVILSPNYNVIDLSQYPPVLDCQLLQSDYRSLYEFMLKRQEYKDDQNFKSLTDAMLRHTQSVYNDLYDEMRMRFVSMIKANK